MHTKLFNPCGMLRVLKAVYDNFIGLWGNRNIFEPTKFYSLFPIWFFFFFFYIYWITFYSIIPSILMHQRSIHLQRSMDHECTSVLVGYTNSIFSLKRSFEWKYFFFYFRFALQVELPPPRVCHRHSCIDDLSVWAVAKKLRYEEIVFFSFSIRFCSVKFDSVKSEHA